MLKMEQKDENESTSPFMLDGSDSSSIGQATQVSGEIRGKNDLVIRGHFHGKINLKENSLTIEESADVNAEIMAKDVTIQGKFDGTIQASGKTEIRNGASVTGDIQAARISIENGAQYKGSIKMHKSPPPE